MRKWISGWMLINCQWMRDYQEDGLTDTVMGPVSHDFVKQGVFTPHRCSRCGKERI